MEAINELRTQFQNLKKKSEVKEKNKNKIKLRAECNELEKCSINK